MRITDEAIAKVNGAGHSIPSKDQSYLLSAFFRRFGTGSADQLVTTRDVESLLRDLPQYTPMEKRDLLLQYAAAKSSKPGERSEYDSHRDYPILFARDEQEADFYVESLFRSGYVVFPPDNYVVVTLDGWQRALDLNQRGKTSPRTFVAMSFDPSQTAAYEQGIRPAIEDAGYEAVRVDRTEHVNRVDDEIVALIRDCRFVVADFTQNRAGVYFEAGFALGLGKTVIWVCNQTDLDQLHFDTRQFNMIDYKMADDLRHRLLNRILAIEGRGPVAASPSKEH